MLLLELDQAVFRLCLVSNQKLSTWTTTFVVEHGSLGLSPERNLTSAMGTLATLSSQKRTSYLAFRKKVEAELQGGHMVTMRGSHAQQGARKDFTQSMHNRLSKKPNIADHLLPEFPPLCKRLTPGPGYLEALTAENVSVIPKSIAKVTSNGIVDVDSTHREVGAIVCATGFDTSFQNRFPIYGLNGTALKERWRDRPSSYLSMTVDGFPNLFMSLGPNSAVGTGNLPHAHRTCLYLHWSMPLEDTNPEHLHNCTQDPRC